MNGIGIGIPFKIKTGASGFPATLTDGTETWRLIADTEDCFNWQHTLTETGFAGTEDIDFYTPYEIDA